METYLLNSTHGTSNPFAHRIGNLIGSIGSPSFEPSFFQIAYEAASCEHLSAFASSDRAPPRLLFAANRGPRLIARAIAERYLKHYWHHDPANVICSRNASPSYEMALRILYQEIDHDDYRHDCYSSVGLVERFSIIRRHNAQTIRLNFYRSARRGQFAAGDLRSILENADILLALLAKHDARPIPADQIGAADVLAQRLRHITPQLTARELDVCIGIVQGRSSEAIALALGVSINTVLTYRKRAYARLRITSHNELMRLALA